MIRVFGLLAVVIGLWANVSQLVKANKMRHLETILGLNQLHREMDLLLLENPEYAQAMVAGTQLDWVERQLANSSPERVSEAVFTIYMLNMLEVEESIASEHPYPIYTGHQINSSACNKRVLDHWCGLGVRSLYGDTV